MIKEIEKLSAPELEVMIKAPLLVCILIAGADNKIDQKEVKGAISLARKGKSKGNIANFYKMVTEDFEDKLKIILQSLPVEVTQRNPIIFEELAGLNPILGKIDKSFATDYYNSLTFIAQEIAESSGGFLSRNRVGEEEERLIRLPMIKNPASR